MLKLHRIAHRIAHFDRVHIAHTERAAIRAISNKRIEALRLWLPALGAEALLLAAFLVWLQHESADYHGLALVFAWVVYGLIALSFLYLWLEPADEETDRLR